MEVIKGIINDPQKVVIYGPEGIGKSSLAAMFPNSIFIDTEGSTKRLNVTRTPKPSSWTMLTAQVIAIKNNPTAYDTLIIDTADWAETLLIDYILAENQKDSLSSFAHGQGYVILEEKFGKFLNLLSDLIELGINIVITAHAQPRKFELPDEMGAFDRWEMKLEKKDYPLLREWADMVLFINYKTYVVNTKDNGKGSNKAQGGKRVIYTTHHPCWDAKNRHGLKDELSFDTPEIGYQEIAHCIPSRINKSTVKPVQVEPLAQNLDEISDSKPVESSKVETPKQNLEGLPKALIDLMEKDQVTVKEIQQAVAKKKYYPVDTPITNYDPQFINGVLVGAWNKGVLQMILDNR